MGRVHVVQFIWRARPGKLPRRGKGSRCLLKNLKYETICPEVRVNQRSISRTVKCSVKGQAPKACQEAGSASGRAKISARPRRRKLISRDRAGYESHAGRAEIFALPIPCASYNGGQIEKGLSWIQPRPAICRRFAAKTNVLPNGGVSLSAEHDVRRLVLLRRARSVQRYIGSSRASFN